MQPTDGQLLLRRIADGDAAAFEEFVRCWERPLARFLERLLGSATLAEDARQLVLLRVYTRASQYRGGSVRSWLFRVAYSVGLNLRRGERRAQLAALDIDVDALAGEPPPDTAAGDGEEHAAVRAALARLDDDDRILVWLRIAEGLSSQETAGVLELPVSTMRYRLARALRRLRAELTALGNGERHVAP